MVDALDLMINQGEFVVLIGESGCGKTTTMKMINRLIDVSKGQILIDGQDIMKMDPINLRRKIGYVIQKVGLFPHMTVGDNIEIIPKLMKWPKEKRKARAMDLLDLVGLSGEEYYDRYPSELSGGQQQRIGFARALAIDPDIILMDEPFSALDPMTREQLQNELLKIQEELHKTIIFVTHDMDEALKLGDKIAVMKDGKILQYASPEVILKSPVNEFVEYFVGKDRLWRSPEMVYARDIMNRKVVKVGENRSSANAIEVMKANGVTSLAIVSQQSDKPQKILGYVTRAELRHATDHQIKMKDVMNTRVHVINESMNMLEVLNYMTNNKIQQVYVSNDEDNLTGVITETNIINLITEISSDIGEEEKVAGDQ
ncbi:osmoprotectant transport system ATP-binding protein [Acidaminobacter hydrogenoformans DSM 2784]|uniref:Quaternary amine transport ATP-binding protein n=1 Tax=Acidaminobacter hydrogenoformans DSM 2784 TaxID=1120920 RepID=A0A1G5S6A5_9FIRM|nr:osmoprotectant transport system ATP-binding protein [Acidaminobacter hydrogenoformans DSM 2784]